MVQCCFFFFKSSITRLSLNILSQRPASVCHVSLQTTWRALGANSVCRLTDRTNRLWDGTTRRNCSFTSPRKVLVPSWFLCLSVTLARMHCRYEIIKGLLKWPPLQVWVWHKSTVKPNFLLGRVLDLRCGFVVAPVRCLKSCQLPQLACKNGSESGNETHSSDLYLHVGS